MATCFYCGLPFYTGFPPAGAPGAAKARRYAGMTLEHLQPVSAAGTSVVENLVLAHTWCNTTAANKPANEKLRLKILLSANNGIPPWWPAIEKIMQKQKG